MLRAVPSIFDRRHFSMSDDDRARARLAWTRAALADLDATLERASADASFRSYWRTRGDGGSWIVMDAPPQHEDIRPWVDIDARLRAAGVHTALVRASDPELGFVLMSDLGNDLYLPALNASSADALYADALDAILRMQRDADCAGLPDYDEPRLVAEMELLPTWFLQRHLGFTPDCDQWDVIELAFRALVTNAQVQPQAFVHRDFHSRNLMVLDKDNPGVVDFQDAVRGPITYDLVSLLRDCYIAWPQTRIDGWREAHRLQLRHAGITHADAAQFKRWFDLMGLQRHIKVLGIFCRLWYRDGKRGYLDDLPLVWRYVREVGTHYPDIAPLVALIERALGERDITQPTA
jgi:aminoglycoside/choline kinase family phosphotransferase